MSHNNNGLMLWELRFESIATTTVGVFRLSANQATLEELVARFDRGENIDLEAPITLPTSAGKVTAMVDTHCVAALLKRWFRELPEPLCTLEMYDMWMAAASINDAQTKIQQVKKVLSFIPQTNQILIKYLASFLREFATYSDVTKMTAVNLSICFAPNLLRPPESIGLADQIEESPIATGLLVMFIEHFDILFASVQGDSVSSASTTEGGPNGKSAPKINLTDNLLPPPPSTLPKPETAPTVPLKKPIPKYGAPKKTSSSKSPSPTPPFTSSDASPSGTSPSTGALSSSPPPPLLPEPLPEAPSEATILNPISLPPPITAPKPKLRSSHDGKEKLRKSAKKSKKGDSASNEVEETEEHKSPLTSPHLPPPPFESLPPPPVYSGPTNPTSPPASPGLKKAPPSRPSTAAPAF